VRADEIQRQGRCGIRIFAYEEMANKKFHEVREATLQNSKPDRMHIYIVLARLTPQTGEICCLFVSSPRRKEGIKGFGNIVVERL